METVMIKSVQVDTNANCGSRCYFCPCRYYKRPHVSLMPNSMFESIITQLDEGVSEGYVTKGYSIWLSSYNDVLHDPFLKDRLDILRKYNKQFQLLTNGINLLKCADLLNEYPDVIHGYSVNLPAGNPEDYSKYTKNDGLIFNQIIKGLNYLYSKNPNRYKQIVSITVNGVYDDDIAKLQTKIKLPDGNTDKQVEQLKKLLPYKIFDARPLCDRAGLLKRVNILDNSAPGVRELWKLPVGAEKATGCNGGSRLYEWLHFSSRGDLYTCCQDYLEKYSWGNVKNDNLKDLIFSLKRYSIVDDTLSGLCPQCWFAY